MDVRERLVLEIPLARFVRKIVRQRPVDIAGMGVVPLDQVGIVAVHRPDEYADRLAQDRVHALGEPVGIGQQRGGGVLEREPGLLHQHRLHAARVHAGQYAGSRTERI